MTEAPTLLDDATLRTLLVAQSDLLISRLAALDDAAARAASLLPGWSRGHVLTHLARNADSLANPAAGAVLDRVIPRYLSSAQRDADIEAGSGRPAEQLVADLAASSGRLLALLDTVPGAQTDRRLPDGRGGLVRIGDLPWMRLREVTYHHVDLALGHGFQDLPAAVVDRGLRECPDRLGPRAPGLRLTCSWTDREPLELTVGDGHQPAGGPAAQVLAWLTGRSAGDGVTSATGPLPPLPRWD